MIKRWSFFFPFLITLYLWEQNKASCFGHFLTMLTRHRGCSRTDPKHFLLIRRQPTPEMKRSGIEVAGRGLSTKIY